MSHCHRLELPLPGSEGVYSSEPDWSAQPGLSQCRVSDLPLDDSSLSKCRTNSLCSEWLRRDPHHSISVFMSHSWNCKMSSSLGLNSISLIRSALRTSFYSLLYLVLSFLPCLGLSCIARANANRTATLYFLLQALSPSHSRDLRHSHFKPQTPRHSPSDCCAARSCTSQAGR